MLKRRNPLFILLISIFLSSTYAFSQQSFVFQEGLNWQITTKADKNQSAKEILWFDGANNNTSNYLLPLYHRQISLPSTGEASIFLTNDIWEACEQQFTALYSSIPSKPELNTYIKRSVLNPSATVTFVPLRKNAETGQIEKLKSFTLNVKFTPVATNRTHRKKDVTESVLAHGEWRKLGVTETAIYKVDQKYFKDLGFDINNTDTRNIKIYGKAGGMLPFANNAQRDEDLAENAIHVQDNNGNNRIDSDDYILFYAKGPVSWKFNKSTGQFQHQVNYYSDTAYYFITVGSSQGKRIGSKPSSAQPGQPVTVFDDYAYHHEDKLTDIIKYVKSGREWFGEDFKSINGSTVVERSFDFSFPEIDFNAPVQIRTGVLARAKNPSTFELSVNGARQANISVDDVDVDDYLDTYAAYSNYTGSFSPPSDNLQIQFRYFKSTMEAIGWLDFIELNVRRNLRYRSGQFAFRDAKNTAAGVYNKYIISNAPQHLQVWDVTDFHDIKRQEASMDNESFTFTAENTNLNEYIAFDGSHFKTPVSFVRIANQNLHALSQPDMIILSHPDFLQAANRLADIRRNQDGFTVHVVTPQQVYNEFSSGTQDISAIRDFARMFYKRAEDGGKKPGYLLLLGDASYDYKYRSAHQTNFIPTFQSANSVSPWGSYCSDDFYGFLDDDEGNWLDAFIYEDMDIAVGRMPVQTLEQANQMIDKIVRYEDKLAKRAWRNTLTFIADDEDKNQHLTHTEKLINDLNKETKPFNINKIYLDAFVQEGSTGQARYPAVKKEVNNDMASGSLVMSYVGHGGELGLAHEKIMEISDINSWENEYKYPLFITPTCEFTRFDDPERTSAGELAYLNPRGGVIAMYTTTRVVSIFRNETLHRNLMLNNMFEKPGNKAKRIGDIFITGKNRTGFDENTRSFTLIGDPSMRLAIPEHNVVVTKVNNTSTDAGTDTLKALSQATIYGEVHVNGTKATDFNGVIYPVVYDKAATKITLANDPGSLKKDFNVQENILYKGKVTVVNGSFQFSFIVPKDISFQKGFGKLSFYAENQVTDAHGYYDSVVVGGSSANPITDDKGPEIALFINDTLFKSGGLVDENPVMLARVKDDIGINTTGSSVGHDLIAVLNGEEEIILNDYYEANLNDYTRGEIRYPFHKLPDGQYNLRVKVWDVANNSAEAYTEFIVAGSAKLAIDKIFNYPNPFSTQTTFSFEHNRPDEDLSVYIGIFSMNGQLIKEIKEDLNTVGNRANTVKWDGRDNTGGEIASGIYVYKLILYAQDGQIAQQSQRLVVIK